MIKNKFPFSNKTKELDIQKIQTFFVNIPDYGLLFRLSPSYSQIRKTNIDNSCFPSLHIRIDWVIPFLTPQILNNQGFKKKSEFNQTFKFRQVKGDIIYITQNSSYLQEMFENFYNTIHQGNQSLFYKTFESSQNLLKDSELFPNELKKSIILFPIDKYGGSFISHAHADHAPINFNLPNIRYKKGKTINYLHPFPILCTPTSQDLLKLRFNLDILSPLPQKDQEINKKSSEMADIIQYFIDLSNYLKEQYFLFEDQKINNRKILTMWPESYLQDYYHPYFWKSGITWLIPSGHIIGSAGICYLSYKNLDHFQKFNHEQFSNLTINNQKENRFNLVNKPIFADTVYLGEFNPNLRPHLVSPPTVICKNLIIDTLFCDPTLKFPNYYKEMEKFFQWMIKTLETNPIILCVRELGKPQLILALLQQYYMQKQNFQSNDSIKLDIPIIVNAQLFKLTQYFSKKGWHIPDIISKRDARKKKLMDRHPFILFASNLEKETPAIKNLRIQKKAKIAEITGWCVKEEYRKEHPADAYFALSDHVVYDDLLFYLKQCVFDTLWIEGGKEMLIASALKGEGIENVRIL